MTLAACSLTFWPPCMIQSGVGANTFSVTNVTFDSDTDRVAWVGRWWGADDTLDVVYFRLGSVTTGCDVTLNIETVTNGRPSGSLVAAGATSAVNIADGDDNAWKTATITTPPTITRGMEFAIIIVVNTAGATPNLNFFAMSSFASGSTGMYPVILQDTGAGAWTNPAGSFQWIVEMGAGVVYLPGMTPLNGNGTITAFNSGTSPNERALRFQVPFKCSVAGLRMAMFNTAAGADFTMSLWPASSDDDTDALGQVSEDGDFSVATTTDGYVDLYFDAAVTLSPATTYYAGLRPDTANSVGLGEMTTATVTNAIRGFPILPVGQCFLSTRVWSAGTAGAWTDTTTTLPVMSLIIDQLDDGASAGGGLRLAGHGGLAA